MNVSIIGAGNIGTQFAVHCAAKNHNVTIFSSKYEKISKELTIVNENNELFLKAEIQLATDDARVAFSNADLIFVTVPSFCMQESAETILPYIKKGAKICLVPGSGGGEFAFKSALEKGAVICGLQRVPSVARLTEYGKTVCASGYRQQLYVASLPSDKAKECADILYDIFDIPCDALPNYLNLTLTPSNPILHTTRLRTIFKDYKDGVFYKSVPLFYENWTMESSELLLKCDKEVQDICTALKEFDLSGVKSLKEHYESTNAEELTKKITGIKSFKGLTTPSVNTEKGFIPDFSSRYFLADFSYGLTLLIQIAAILNVDSTNMTEVMAWYTNINKTENSFVLSKYNINTKADLIEFYK